MKALDHRSLRQFLAVAETGSVRAAARQLNMTQPPLTQALQLLEARLGAALFERTARGMTLTAAGLALAEETRLLLSGLERAERRVKAAAQQSMPLRIGFVSAALNEIVPSLLRNGSKATLPKPELFEMTTPEQIAALQDGRIDLGLLHPPAKTLAGIAALPLGRDPFLAALPADHALAGRRSLRLRDIAREPLVLFTEMQGPVLYDRIRREITHLAGRMEVAAEARRTHSQLALVSGGAGVGLVTASTARTLSVRDVNVVPLSDTADWLFLELEARCPAALLPQIAPLLKPAGRQGRRAG